MPVMASIWPTIVAEGALIPVRCVRVPVYVHAGSALASFVPLLVGERRKRATGEKDEQEADKELFHLRVRRLARFRGLGLCRDIEIPPLVESGHRHEGFPSTPSFRR